MENAKMSMGKIIRGVTVGALMVLVFTFLATMPALAQGMRNFEPIDRTGLYEREFLNDFYTALGYRPEGLTWIDESATVNLMVTAAVQADRGDSDAALLTYAMLPPHIASAFPFLATMKEDLLVPTILEPWYDFDEAREMIFTFYTGVWLPHPEYRDDYMTFRDDTMGRASRRDPTVPTVWILGHLADYGFVPDRALSQDDPYLFLWDLLTGITYYAQRATYYGLDWQRYNEYDYKLAVLRKTGAVIRAAHEVASQQEMARGFWGDLIESRHPFEAPTEGTESSGIVQPTSQPVGTEPTSQPVTQSETTTETVEESVTSLFETPRVETEPSSDELYQELELRIQDLAAEVGVTLEVEEPVVVEEPGPVVTEEPVDTVPPELGPEVETSGEIEEEIPDEFMYEPGTEQTPSESEPEVNVPGELGNYATIRLEEIADELAVRIGSLASDLGRETIDLVMLYNDVNVTDETIVNAEDRYTAKREAFLAGVALWDRFNMEIFTPLTLADFNDLVVADLEGPYNELKAAPVQWSQYQAYESHFEEAFGQIEAGVRNRRDEPDVLAAEAAALTAFLGEYNDIIKEIEDLLSGVITEPPVEETVDSGAGT